MKHFHFACFIAACLVTGLAIGIHSKTHSKPTPIPPSDHHYFVSYQFNKNNQTTASGGVVVSKKSIYTDADIVMLHDALLKDRAADSLSILSIYELHP